MQVLDSLVEGMRQLPDARDQQHYAWALLCYLIDGSEPEGLRPVARAMLTANKPVLDNSRARAAAGAKGGRKRQANAKQTASKAEANGEANAKQTPSKREAKPEASAKQTPRNPASEEEEEEELEETPPNGGAKKRTRFVPPTADEVRAYAEAYCRGKPLVVNVERFMNHYQSNGWRVGRNQMRDWRAAVRNWAETPSSGNANGGDYDEYFGVR